jgi:hypothetical protein
MSTFADSSKARVWLDGDIFRAPAGTAIPTGVGALWAASISGFDAYGGIRAGFQVDRTRKTTPLDVWNNTSGAAYKTKKDAPTASIKFEPVDYSKATVLTLLRGGSIVETPTGSGQFEHVEGTDEEFALLLRVKDGTAWKAYYVERCELTDIPPEKMDATDIEGFAIDVTPLAPVSGLKAVRKFTNTNPLA